LSSRSLGKIYYSKITYANGTARSNSNNVGSILDMASHCVNLLMWLFNSNNLEVINSSNQKNEFSKIHPDNGFATLKIKNILISLHHGFCNWKNKFSLEIYGKKGSLKVHSLPKWSNQIVIREKRILPSGQPKAKIKKFKHDLSFKNELYFLLKTISNMNNINHQIIKKINYESYYTLKNSNLLK
jgi:predicted dehydrogenase